MKDISQIRLNADDITPWPACKCKHGKAAHNDAPPHPCTECECKGYKIDYTKNEVITIRAAILPPANASWIENALDMIGPFKPGEIWKKRGPKPRPAATHHKMTAYKHAPDVTALLAEIPAGYKRHVVDNAIRAAFNKDIQGLTLWQIKRKLKQNTQ